MKKRMFGNTGKMVSEIGLGTWQLGTRWGDEFNKEEAIKILDAAKNNDINFIDTAKIRKDLFDDYYRDSCKIKKKI